MNPHPRLAEVGGQADRYTVSDRPDRRTFNPSGQDFPRSENLRTSRKHGQAHASLLKLCNHMSLSLSVRKAVLCLSLAAVFPSLPRAEASYATHGSEYSATGSILGDQVKPRLALNSSGGFLVWQDNRTDGDGLGVGAVRLDSGFSQELSPFRVNESGTGDQENPSVALLQSGGAVFVWQSGPYGAQRIFARFLAADDSWATGEIQVSQTAGETHAEPVAAVLSNGNIVVVWTSLNAVNRSSMRDVYGQVLTPQGEKVGDTFLVNSFTQYNQRNPAVAALSTGGFVVTWISEQQRALDNSSPVPGMIIQGNAPPSVDVFARSYAASAMPTGPEQVVNTDNSACSNPAVASVDGGGFIVGWSQNDALIRNNGWDIFVRVFSAGGTAAPAQRINSHTYGDQLAPQLATVAQDVLAVWTSLAQDGSREGVYGQFLKSDGTRSASEFRVNTSTASKQMHPALGADPEGRFLVAWTSYTGGNASFDLFAQRYANAEQPLWQMAAPFLSVPFTLSNQTYQPEIQVSWPEQTGIPLQGYKVFVDGTERATVANNSWVMTADDGLKANESHSFQVAFVTQDGRVSPVSPSATAKTWGGFHWGGIPGEWMSDFYGTDFSSWPAATRKLAEDGPTLLDVFVSGGSPLNPSTWLRAAMVPTEQGVYLEWNPQAGLTYQVQSSTDLNQWTNVGGKRFAAGTKDSLFLGYGSSAYYRVVLMR